MRTAISHPWLASPNPPPPRLRRTSQAFASKATSVPQSKDNSSSVRSGTGPFLVRLLHLIWSAIRVREGAEEGDTRPSLHRPLSHHHDHHDNDRDDAWLQCGRHLRSATTAGTCAVVRPKSAGVFCRPGRPQEQGVRLEWGVSDPASRASRSPRARQAGSLTPRVGGQFVRTKAVPNVSQIVVRFHAQSTSRSRRFRAPDRSRAMSYCRLTN
jgi:hypothetical protein